ncbi:MAG: protein TolQ [Bdellovibrionaceae bacterium]|nr:protein TolQ [Pseudobdellovibrionaceae bacterium]
MNYAYASEALKSQVNVSTWDAISHASPIVQLTLLILIIMSVVSWAIAITKHKQFNEITEADAKFEHLFWRANSLDDIYAALEEFKLSSMAKVFKLAYLELRKLADSSGDNSEEQIPALKGIDNLERALRKASDSEISKLESRLSFLATTGSTGPFIGLFGTVWGIMGAFQKIGATGMASLAVVAPGISEALIATAIGLVAAIPATIFYNHYVSKIRKVDLALNNFSADFLNIAKRNFFKEG